MNEVLKDIEVLEKSLTLDDFGRQLLIFDMVMRKKQLVEDFEADMAPAEFELNKEYI
jgi:hypothetical protein|tara:strand:+ start:208 stop:378 length:171 start_codon:yes stop_codon:yes gene_type:complete